MARVKQVATKPRKLMGNVMQAAGRIEKEREEETKVESSDEEIETVAELERKRKGKGIAGSKPSKKKKKMEKAPALKPFVQQNIFEPRIGTFKDTKKLEGYDEKAFQLSIFLEDTPENEMTNISLVPQNFRIL
ncbi:hypothetical protein GH714_035980 [Hevea brasiliensis]|uniref:Uncharacterized protein n=1 Tax=Hevea brasiliensis TaxID=3981 RepID=A0A6A6KYA4_HEVBR|nr:hypothetical protein GH714_035980 [Hevea brasiliensis]